MSTGPQARFNAISPWVEPPADLQPALQGAATADVVIVGGGYAGLSAALRLRANGCDVVVLEQAFCGAGASGRNAGHLTPTIGKDVYTCIRQWGRERGLALAAFAKAAVAATEATIHELGIDCDYMPVGNIVAGLHPSHRKLLEQSAAATTAAGVPLEFLDAEAMAARGLPRAFTSGVFEPEGGHLHPGKYVQGLRRAAIRAGVRIHESTPVTALERGRRVRARTPLGAVKADRALVATNAYLDPDLARARGRLLPLELTLFRTAPLTDAQLAAIGWGGREGVYTAHEVMESYRIGADRRLVGGSKWIAYGPTARSSQTPPAGDLLRYDELVKARFPEVPDLAIESYWNGWIAATVDYLPVLDLGDGPVCSVLGCNGHGIALSSCFGTAAADHLLGVPRPDLDVFRRWLPPIPTGALRGLAFKVVAGPLERRDQRIDAEIRAGRA